MTIVIACKSHGQSLKVRAAIEHLVEPLGATIKNNPFTEGVLEFEGFPGFSIILVNRLAKQPDYQGIVFRAEDILDNLPEPSPQLSLDGVPASAEDWPDMSKMQWNGLSREDVKKPK